VLLPDRVFLQLDSSSHLLKRCGDPVQTVWKTGGRKKIFGRFPLPSALHHHERDDSCGASLVPAREIHRMHPSSLGDP
jgi:hypothetical protein